MLPSKRSPVHPGVVLQHEFLEPLGLSQKAFADHLGGSWSQPKLSAIVNGRRGITEAIALDFSDALGTTAKFWLNLQANYDLWQAQKRHKKIPRIPRTSARPREQKVARERSRP